MTVKLTFVGTGEAFDPDLPNTSLLYQGGKALLLDCGYSVPHAFWKLSRDPDLLDAIYVTHLHADHSFGLPALLLWLGEAGRSRPLRLIGGRGVDHWLKRLLDLAYPGSLERSRGYEIDPFELAPGETLELGELWLSNAESDHPVRNSSICLAEAGKRVCYSGDGNPTDATLALYQNADVLVHECYTLERETRGHARAVDLFAAVERAGVRKLCLLHVSRDEKAAVRRYADTYRGALEIVWAEPGASIEV